MKRAGQLTLGEALVEQKKQMAIAADNDGKAWQDYAYTWCLEYLREHTTLFIDDLWMMGLKKGPGSSKSIGVVLRRLATDGMMEQQTIGTTEDFVARRSAASHGTPKPVWRSLIFTGSHTELSPLEVA